MGGGDLSQGKFQRCIAEGDLDFVSVFSNDVATRLVLFLVAKNLHCLIFVFTFKLKFLSFDELKGKMANLDQDMEREIDDLRRRYHAKRQPILDAMDQKRKRQQNF